MLHKAFVIFWLAFLSLWLGVIAPGHERGSIRLPGSPAVACHMADHERPSTHADATTPSSSCCAGPASAAGSDSSTQEDTDEHRPVDPASCCAICYLNSVLDTPEPLVFIRVCDGLLEELEPLEPATISGIFACFSLRSRGPPLQFA